MYQTFSPVDVHTAYVLYISLFLWHFYTKTALQIIFLSHHFCPFLTIRFLSNRLKEVIAINQIKNTIGFLSIHK